MTTHWLIESNNSQANGNLAPVAQNFVLQEPLIQVGEFFPITPYTQDYPPSVFIELIENTLTTFTLPPTSIEKQNIFTVDLLTPLFGQGAITFVAEGTVKWHGDNIPTLPSFRKYIRFEFVSPRGSFFWAGKAIPMGLRKRITPNNMTNWNEPSPYEALPPWVDSESATYHLFDSCHGSRLELPPNINEIVINLGRSEFANTLVLTPTRQLLHLFPQNFSLQVSNDNISFTNCFTVNWFELPFNPNPIEFVFPTTSGQWWKLHFFNRLNRRVYINSMELLHEI